ncbi:MAG: elongation factor P maturation arginine rhamnosyltransferase EarP [Gammaproteobacteria bacterium]|nr:elongation factor P maturation arginine rhamnosyltransferase EarP [Gammaproteobacteria bacterium]|tara:strand:- start:1019 stop:2284 length:1266 start_codon:yes stop_codon:yes gene_type:complete
MALFMSVPEHAPANVAPAWSCDHDTWLVFCTAIDNFGDIGVCWRLARQLVVEHEQQVVLYIDDWHKALVFLQREDGCSLTHIEEQGVLLRRWHDGIDWTASLASAGMVIEAFGCSLPDTLIEAMAKEGGRRAPPCWVNLEYLSAEAWVEDYHGQQSIQSAPVTGTCATPVVLKKTFFFPGFTAATGGLIRERHLLASHQAWQAEQARTRAELVPASGCAHDRSLWISLFAYPRPPGNVALRSWFAALAEGAEPVLCVVPAGSLLVDVADALELTHTPAVGEVICRDSLSVAVIPFLSLDDYDRLLSVCDLNLVRGEDSFVRAQWAARPLIWHIYPQQDDAHQLKLDAFLERYGEDRWSPGSADKLARFTRFWNLDADCRKLWHDLRPQLPDLTHRARNWQQKLAALPDLASSLMQFYRNRP